MIAPAERVRVSFIVVMNFLIVYVSVPMIWGVAIMYTAVQRAVGRGEPDVIDVDRPSWKEGDEVEFDSED
jgi:hypothetical protein